MAHIVKSEISRASWQTTADVTALVVAVAILATLGIAGALTAASPLSVAIAALVGLTAILFVPATYAISQQQNEAL
ncbi:MAG: hypothetical protein E7L06_03845 [Schaalia turicensis]|nr:hypothetical protein [Schaalia turicensis]